MRIALLAWIRHQQTPFKNISASPSTMPSINWKRHTQIFNKYKTYSTQSQCTYKNAQTGEPIRHVINNTQVPLYKRAIFLNKKLQSLIYLPNTYTTKNSYEVAQELHNKQFNEQNRTITLDIKHLYFNLPTKNFLRITEFCFNRSNHDPVIIEQDLYLLKKSYNKTISNKITSSTSPIKALLWVQPYLAH